MGVSFGILHIISLQLSVFFLVMYIYVFGFLYWIVTLLMDFYMGVSEGLKSTISSANDIVARYLIIICLSSSKGICYAHYRCFFSK